MQIKSVHISDKYYNHIAFIFIALFLKLVSLYLPAGVDDDDDDNDD